LVTSARQAAALDMEALSQCDVVICQALASIQVQAWQEDQPVADSLIRRFAALCPIAFLHDA